MAAPGRARTPVRRHRADGVRGTGMPSENDVRTNTLLLPIHGTGPGNHSSEAPAHTPQVLLRRALRKPQIFGNAVADPGASVAKNAMDPAAPPGGQLGAHA